MSDLRAIFGMRPLKRHTVSGWRRQPPRPEHPIVGIAGSRGSGKSLYAVGRYILPALRSGVPVAATIGVHDPIDHAPARRLLDWPDCLDVQDGLILIDEAHRWAPSREWQKLPENTRAFWAHSRKYGLGVVLTFQHPARIDKALRELIDELYWIERVALFGRRTPYFRVWTVPLTQGLVETGTLPSGGHHKLWRAPDDAWDAYDTMEQVELPTSRVSSELERETRLRLLKAGRNRRYRARVKARELA